MDSRGWEQLLQERGVDVRIVGVMAEVAATRTVEPPTTETKQLLISVETDGYAAGRVAGSVLSLFFEPARAREIADRHGFAVGRRNATSVVRVPAADIDVPVTRGVVIRLLNEALDRIAYSGSWNRGLPDTKKAQGDVCPVHRVQRSLTGVCPDCD